MSTFGLSLLECVVKTIAALATATACIITFFKIKSTRKA